MKSIWGHIRLRPIRIGLLVRPSDKASIQKFMRYCTCLWGGTFNPIIPIVRQLPNAWKSSQCRPSGIELAKRYVHFFEPDVFVEAEPGFADKLGYAGDELIHGFKRAMTFEELFCEGNEPSTPTFQVGLNIYNVYKKLHDEEYKFVRKKEQDFVLFTSTKKGQEFFDAVYGCFPDEKEFSYISKAYKSFFEPKVLTPTLDNFRKTAQSKHVTPMSLTKHQIKSRYYDNTWGPKIFVFDPNNPADLIDLWNMRIFENDILPVNVHWFENLSDLIVKFIKRQYQSHPGNPHGVMINTTIEFSESIPEETSKHLVNEHIKDRVLQDSIILEKNYTQIWKDHSDNLVIHLDKAKLDASSSSIDILVDESNKTSRIKSLAPNFSGKLFFPGRFCWANILRYDSRLFEDNIACCFPQKLRAKDFPTLSQFTPTLTSREGIVILNEQQHDGIYLNILSGEQAFIQWLKEREIATVISQAGRTTKEIISSVGGLWGTRLLANKEIITLLNKMANKEVRRNPDHEDDIINEHEGKTAKIAEWTQILDQIQKRKGFLVKPTLMKFTTNNILRLGLFITCKHCEQNNWYDLKAVDYSLHCEHCLNKFDFPQDQVHKQRDLFRYRVIGPFSTTGAANGGYATALTLRLFMDPINDSRLTYTTSLILKFNNDIEIEIDFALWYERVRSLENSRGIEMVFGESKSFAKEGFKEKDVKKMYHLAEKFPGSFFVFSTFKPDLSKNEKKLISKFVKWGKKKSMNGKPRAQVIIFTETELFANISLLAAWEDLGGKYAEVATYAFAHLGNLSALAIATQNLYLDMSSKKNFKPSKKSKLNDVRKRRLLK